MVCPWVIFLLIRNASNAIMVLVLHKKKAPADEDVGWGEMMRCAE